MTQHRPVLELEADVDGDGTPEKAWFVMAGNVEYQPNGQTRYSVIKGGKEEINEVGNILNGKGINRRGYYVDAGAGKYTHELNFNGWKGAVTSEGDSVQWGNTDTETLTEASATGQDPLAQIHVFMQYWRVGRYDSDDQQARLMVGEYSSSSTGSTGSEANAGPSTAPSDGQDGVYANWLNVVIPNVVFVQSAENPQAYNGSITLAEKHILQEVSDAGARTGF